MPIEFRKKTDVLKTPKSQQQLETAYWTLMRRQRDEPGKHPEFNLSYAEFVRHHQGIWFTHFCYETTQYDAELKLGTRRENRKSLVKDPKYKSICVSAAAAEIQRKKTLALNKTLNRPRRKGGHPVEINGVYFSSITSAALILNKSYQTVRARICSDSASFTGWKSFTDKEEDK